FYGRALRALLNAPTVDGPGDVPRADARKGDDALPLRWEFYVGGMFGLLLAFVLRATELSQDELILEAVKAGVGSIFWFGSFALSLCAGPACCRRALAGHRILSAHHHGVSDQSENPDAPRTQIEARPNASRRHRVAHFVAEGDYRSPGESPPRGGAEFRTALY